MDALLTKGGAETTGPVRAVIAPARGVRLLGRRRGLGVRGNSRAAFNRVVLLGPSHHFGFEGAAVPDAATAMRTPLGDVPIDRDAVARLRESTGFRADDTHLRAGARARGRASVPAAGVGGRRRRSSRCCSADARATTTRDASPTRSRRGSTTPRCVVVSSDFTHYGPRFGYVPFTDDLPRRIRELDHGAIAAIEAGDAAEFARYVETTGATICGHRAIDVLLLLPPAAREADVSRTTRPGA